LKIILKRIIGFIEFALGLVVVEIMIFGFIAGLISGELFTKITWKSLIQIPFALLIYPSLIKYGWYWMFNIVDITDIKLLKPNDPYFISAREKSQADLEIFLSYLRKIELPCSVLAPKDLNNRYSKRIWQYAEYFNETEITIVVNNEKKINVPLSLIDDWQVVKDDVIIGNYTFKALAEKATRNGEKLSKKSKRKLERIVT
jgi:hypothetical protein